MNKEMNVRSFLVPDGGIDEEKRTVEVAFSSETPVLRYDPEYGEFYEVLGHKESEVDTSFIGSGRAPVLSDHDRNQQVGVISKVEIGNSVGRASLRFGKSSRASDEFADVVDGVRSNISVGYYVKRYEPAGEKDGTPMLRATSWSPAEISFVSIPADVSVGVGRALNTETTKTITTKEITMTDKTEKKAEAKVDLDAIRAEASASEQTRVQKILATGSRYGMSEKAEEFVRNNKPAADFNDYVLENMEQKKAESAPVDKVAEVRASAGIGLTEKEAQRYDIVKALRAKALGHENPQFIKDAAFEMEASKAAAEMAVASGVSSVRGLMVPYDVLVRATDTVATDGSLVGTDHMGSSFIEILRNKMVIRQLGARFMSGLQGNVAIPRHKGTGTAYWIADENSGPTESDQTFDQVTLSPKNLAARGAVSRQLLLQSDPSIQAIVQDDLATIVAIEMDRAALYGTGASGQPLGLVNQTGISSNNSGSPLAFAAFATPGAPTFAEVVGMEGVVETDNALLGSLKYLTDPSTKSNLKVEKKDSGSGEFVLEGGSMNGYTVETSNQVVANDLFYGNWNDMIVGLWGGLDIVVDPYTLAHIGQVRTVVYQTCDIAVRHPESFAYGK